MFSNCDCLPLLQEVKWAVTMAPFLRISFIAYDVGVLPPVSDPPICAVKMKESVPTGTYTHTHTQS